MNTIDNINPIINACVADKDVILDASCNFTLPDYTTDAALSITECSTYEITQSPVAGNIISDTTTVTITVADEYGNTASCDFRVMVNDTINPTFTVPPDIIIFKDNNCNYDASTIFTGDVTDELDNCNTSLEATYSDAITIGSCEGEEIITRTWSLTDKYFNTTQKVQIITIRDTINPTFTVPVDITIYKDTDCNFDASLGVTGDVTDEDDNCDSSLDAAHTDLIVNGSCEGEEIITRTWSLTDDCGNMTRKVQIITISDTINPAFTVPATDTICRDQLCNYNMDPSVTGDVTDEEDNCSTNLDATYSDNFDNLTSCDTAGYVIRTWSLQDKCGNIALKYQIIWVEPTTTITATPASDTLCSGESTTIQLNSISSPTLPVLFRYETQIPFGITVNPGVGNILPNGFTISDLVQNSTDTAKRVLFIITPYTQDGSGFEKCPGISDTTEIWVEPVPKIGLDPIIDTICTSLRPLISSGTVTRSLQPVRFIYEAEYSFTDVEVFYAQDTFDLVPGSATIIDSIVNHSNIPQRVTFIAYPYLKAPCGTHKCSGIPDTSYVWVAPSLKIIVDTISTYIGGRNIRCYGLSDGFIRLQPSGGITAFPGYDDSDLNYSWNSGWKTSRDIINLNAGVYEIAINDKLFCADDSSFTITQPDVLESLIADVHELSCYGNDGIIAPSTDGGTQGYSYTWVPPIDYYLYPSTNQDTLENIIPGYYYLSVTDANGCQYETNRLINPPGAVKIIAQPTKYYKDYEIRCNGDNSGELGSYNRYMELLTYHWWSTNGFDTSFTNNNQYNYLYNLNAGQYTLTYIDESNGCSGFIVIDLDQPDPVRIDQATVSAYSGGYNVKCYGSEDGSIQLNSISGGHVNTYEYLWKTVSGTEILDTAFRNQGNLSAGKYEVTIADTFACAVTDTFELLQPSDISINAELSLSVNGAYNINCNADTTGYIKLLVAGGGSGAYNYEWETIPETTNEIFNLPAGNYFVKVIDGLGCLKKDTFTLTQPAPFRIDAADLSSHNGYGISCYDETDGSIRIWPSGGALLYSYDWAHNGSSLGRDTSFIDNLQEGIYHLVMQDANGCQISWQDTLKQPSALMLTIESHNINCTGTVLGSAQAIVSGGVPDYDYNWENGSTTSAISGLNAGAYELTLTDMNQCVAKDTAIIEQNTEVLVEIKVLNAISCNKGSDGLLEAVASDGVGSYGYEWQDGSAEQTLSNVPEGTYSVTVTDEGGCVGNATIDLADPESLIPVVSVADASCFDFNDGLIELGAMGGTPGYTYHWDNKTVNGNEVGNLKAGAYSFIVTDAENCETDTLVIIGQPARLTITWDENNSVIPYCSEWHNGAVAVKVSGGTRSYDYEWVDFSEEGDSVLENITEGKYTVAVTDAHGCFTDTTIILKSQNNTCLVVPTAFTPNPELDNANNTWEVMYISEDGSEEPFSARYPGGTMKIYDRLGNLVYHCSGGCPETWDGEDMKDMRLPVDTYYYVIDPGHGASSLRGIVTIIR